MPMPHYQLHLTVQLAILVGHAWEEFGASVQYTEQRKEIELFLIFSIAL